MPCVYILQSQVSGKFYFGSTNDIRRRLTEHNSGKSKATMSGRPWQLKYKYEVKSLAESKRIEAKLKKLKSRQILKSIIKEGKIRFLGN